MPSNEIVVGDGSPIASTTPRSIRPPEAPRLPAPLGQREKIAQSKEVISISTLRQEVKEKAEQEDPDLIFQETADRAYQEAEVLHAWAEFLQSGKVPQGQLWAALTLAKPSFSDNVLKLGFPSETQVIYFNDVRLDLANYFKEVHQIKGLKFVTEVLKEVETHKNLMTITQRFESLRKDNPAIEKLYRVFQMRMD